MKYRAYIYTLALMGALALSALSGGLLHNVVYAVAPTFDADTTARSVPENTPPGVNIGAPISATDPDETGEAAIEFGNTLTYKLGGDDAASFDIDPSTGQLITKAPLDYEDVDNQSYSVTVTVDDGETRDTTCTACTRDVTITVTGEDEKPGALAAPTVVSTDSDNNAETFDLKVIWYAPDDTGDGVTGYDVQFKKSTAVSFTDDDHSGTTTSTTIDDLDADTSYQVRVRATNGVGNGPWSLSSAGSTNKKDNVLPTFRETTVTRTVLENAEPGLVVGAPVSAMDDDNVLPLTYGLHGPDAESFDLHATSGQIRTKRGVAYDSETKATLRVTMTVSDGQGGSDARAVTITVVDVPEAPSVPARPTVRATPKSSRSLDVTWSEPENTGPAITGYDVRYRESGSNDTFRTTTATATNVTIAPTDIDPNDGDDRLTPGASYEVSVRAKNGEISSVWSAAGTGRTSIGNSEPVFDDRSSLTDTDPTTERTVAENTRPGQSVGRAVGAVDGNGDRRTYRLAAATEAAHVAKFDINESSGQILTEASLNHEATDCDYVDTADQTTCTYTVKVEVWDGLDEHRNEQDTSTITEAIIDDTITVEIMVSDVAERPVAPTVVVTSSAVATGETAAPLTVTWDKPEDMGPPLTGYVVECTGDGITPANPCPQPIDPSLTDTEVSYNITGLTPNKPYRVRVRADNDEGQGAWSSWVMQSTSKEGNNLPSFTSPPSALYVVENAPSARQQVTSDEAGAIIVALEAADDDNDSLTYRLYSPGAGRFDIDRNGQIRTTSKLNHEDPECDYDNTASPTSCSYTVRVKLSDPNGGSVVHDLVINVTDAEEPPAAPPAPRVTATAGSGWSLEVTWSEPRNTGPPISSYEIQYRKAGDTDWEDWSLTDTSRSTKITTIPALDNNDVHLEPSTQYEVQVRALNGEEDTTENWSSSGRGTTGASNRRPTFGSDTPSLIRLEVDENTRSGQNIGSAVEATDPDGNRLIYTLEGPGKDSFTVTSDGQIRTRASLNYEERSRYSVTVKVNDGQGKDNSVAAQSVAITVMDRSESPSAPAAPTVTGVPGSTDSVRVTWDEPANPGAPITHYNVQYAVSGSRDAFQRVMVPTGSADRSVIITGLTAGTRYDVQVRAQIGEVLHSDWSHSGTGSPNPDVANRTPAFSGGALTFSIAENTPPGADVGSLVAALDPDGDVLTYILEGIDADSFDIIATNGAGQIQTKAALNHEEKSRYSVAVRVRDGRGGTDAVNVTINVTDVDNEAPDTPFAPTVEAISSTSLQVSWDAPENAGPPITDYDYRYQTVTDSGWTEVTNTTIRGTTITVDGLTPSTSYDVEVRAKNAEGTSGWSNPGNGATNEPGANNPPVFSDGASATRSVSATATAGTSIGLPVAATDADSGDTLTYSLEGRDAANFDITTSNGQLLTKSGITLIAGETYTVTVAADDQTDIARITVSINATAAPPNNPPVFSEGASATRSVSAGAQAGTSIGLPVAATDADSGDTLTYSHEGQDAASFNINTSTGQLLTISGVTLTAGEIYTVTVAASDGKTRASITVTIEVTTALPNTPPTFSSTTATRSVDENTPAGTDIGLPVSATDANAGDTLTYRLSGADAASFNIVSGTGQLRTNAALDYETKFRYSVTVTVSDGELTDTISVTINVMDMHPSCASAIGNGANTGLANDCEALLDSKQTLEGTTGSLNWATFTPITQWDGIYVNGTPKRVTRLLLRKMPQLDGTIPAELGRLSGLENLSLYANGLTGPIPAELGNLSRLTVMYINNNKLSGTIPAELGNLNNLERLWLHGNSLSGSIPTQLGRLSNLEWLSLYTNSLTKSIPTQLGDLTNLKVLYLHANELTGSIPTQLGDLTNLQLLYLWGNDLSGSIPTELGDLSNLRVLSLGRNRLTGAIPPQLGNLSNLERLYIYGDKDDSLSLDGGIPPQLGNLTKLTTLVLQYAGLTGTIPTQLGNMTDLEWLNIQNNRLNGSIPMELDSLSNLKRLYLHYNQLTGAIPSELGNLSELTNLWLKSNRLSGEIPPELGNLANLERVRISRNPGLTGCIPAALTDSAGVDSDAEALNLPTCTSGN